jgi:hypothetical protein
MILILANYEHLYTAKILRNNLLKGKKWPGRDRLAALKSAAEIENSTFTHDVFELQKLASEDQLSSFTQTSNELLRNGLCPHLML